MSTTLEISKAASLVFEKIVESENRDPDASVTLDSRFDDDLGIDSLARVDLIVSIEKHYNIVLDEGELTDVVVVGDLVRIVENTIDS